MEIQAEDEKRSHAKEHTEGRAKSIINIFHETQDTLCNIPLFFRDPERWNNWLLHNYGSVASTNGLLAREGPSEIFQ